MKYLQKVDGEGKINLYKCQDEFEIKRFRFHTGDIGILLPSKALKIVDRKSNIFKLSQGEYVAPEKIEAVYLKAPLVAQIFVHGHLNKVRSIYLIRLMFISIICCG